MDIEAGETFLLVPRGRDQMDHLYIALTDNIKINDNDRYRKKFDDADCVLLVNITSLDEEDQDEDYDEYDQEKIVRLNDSVHEFIEHQSYLYYQSAHFEAVRGVEYAINRNSISKKHDDDIHEDHLAIIRRGLLECSDTPGHIETYCQGRFDW